MPCDPNALLEQAKCINACVPQGMMQAAGLALLCNIANGGGGGGGGPTFPAGATHYWTLNEASGNTRADSIGSMTLSENGGVVASAVGKNGNAADFNGIPTRSLRAVAGLGITDFPFSFMVWVNVDTLPGSGACILTAGDPSGGGVFVLSLVSTGNVELFPGFDSEDVPVVALGSLDTWHLLVGSCASAASCQLSIDGGTFDNGTSLGFGGDDGISIGNGLINAIDGLIDAVAIWNRALTQQEATDLWNGGAGLFP